MTPERLADIEARHMAATPGPWNWRVNLKHRNVELCAGHRANVMCFVRWGMDGATPTFIKGGLIVKAHEMAKVIASREHHADWCQTIDHPDAEFIAHAPQDVADLLTEVKRLTDDFAVYAEVEADLRANVEIPDGVDMAAMNSDLYDDIQSTVSECSDSLNTIGAPGRSEYRDALIRIAALAVSGVIAIDQANAAGKADV